MAKGLDQYSKAVQETAENLRVIDDAMFRLVAGKKDVCQEMLRTLLDMPNLNVIKVEPQRVIASFNREITLDALCVLEDGNLCNIEMQTTDINDDVKRARFHASAITSRYTPKGSRFSDIPNVKIIYITEYDAIGDGQMITSVRRCKMSNGKLSYVNDGEEIIFANTTVDDGTNKAELLQLLLRQDAFNKAKFPAISKAVNYFKKSNGGKEKMCKAIENLCKDMREEFEKEIAEKDSALAESKSALAEKDALIRELRAKLAVAGIN